MSELLRQTHYAIEMDRQRRRRLKTPANMLTDGHFDTDVNWTKGTGWTISGGVASCDGTQTANSLLFQSDVVPTNGEEYVVQFDLYLVAGLIRPFVGGASAGDWVSTTGAQRIKQTISQGGINGNIYLQANPDFVGHVDNVHVQKVL